MPYLDDSHCDRFIDVDASAHSVGAVLADNDDKIQSTTFRDLPTNLIEESSTARELYAVRFGLESFLNAISGKVCINIDNQSAAIICKKGAFLCFCTK